MTYYAPRDHVAQGAYYLRHVSAMTGEGLHAKSAIAGELAHRDMRIDQLLAENNLLAGFYDAHVNLLATLGHEDVTGQDERDAEQALDDAKAAVRMFHHRPPTAAAWADVLGERRRQVEVEGWTAEHDAEHDDQSLAWAAACYAMPDPLRFGGDLSRWREGAGHVVPPLAWPQSWHPSWWKPKDRRSDLVRAAALLLAEIERLDRARG